MCEFIKSLHTVFSVYNDGMYTVKIGYCEAAAKPRVIVYFFTSIKITQLLFLKLQVFPLLLLEVILATTPSTPRRTPCTPLRPRRRAITPCHHAVRSFGHHRACATSHRRRDPASYRSQSDGALTRPAFQGLPPTLSLDERRNLKKNAESKGRGQCWAETK